MSSPVVFFDKDGTLVDDVPYNVNPSKIRLAAGAAEGLPRLAAGGYRLAVVSNQSGVARGYFPETALVGVAAKLRALLGNTGVSLAGFFYCPHHPKGIVPEFVVECGCRKPAPGLVLAAAHELGADPRDCWVVGDILDDVEAGRRAGCRTVLIDTGNETEWVPGPFREPHFTARDLAETAGVILGSTGRPNPPAPFPKREGGDRAGRVLPPLPAPGRGRGRGSSTETGR
jgi:histidinol-phosphate phosphatase family protein